MSERQTISAGAVKPCCQRPENLVAERLSADLIVRVCRECGCRHFEANAEPGVYGLRGSAL